MDSRVSQVRRLGQSFWRLGSCHAAAYLVRGAEASAIFEAGISATAPLVLSQIDALGVAREEVRHLIISHAHADHATGQAGLMAGLPRATLLLTQASADFLARPKTLEHYAYEDGFTSAAVAERDGLTSFGPWPALSPLLPSPWRVLDPAEELDLGGVSLRFLADQGHAPGGLIAHIPQEGAVLAADSAGFANHQGQIFPLYFVSYTGYLKNLDEIAALSPTFLGLGHQVCFEGPDVDRYLAHLAEYLASERKGVRRDHAAGVANEDLVRGMFQRHYHGEMTLYSAEGIVNCCRILVRRSLEG